MTQFNSSPGKNIIMIGGQAIRSGRKGDFKVSHALILSEDLSHLPIGTQLIITYSRNEMNNHQFPLKVKNIEVMANNTVFVTAEYYECPNCWRHAMNFMKFTEVAMILLKDESTSNSCFDYLGVDVKSGDPTHHMTVVMDNGLFIDIEARVNTLVMTTVKSLHDAKDAIDAQILKQFGV